MTAGGQTHHLHVDSDDQGHSIVHCLRCGQSEHGRIPAEPCPNPDVAVLCCTADVPTIVITADEAGRR